MRLFWEFNKAMVGFYDEEEEIDLEEIMQEDVITMMVEELSRIAPSVTKILIYERDAFIAKKLYGLTKKGKVSARRDAGGGGGVGVGVRVRFRFRSTAPVPAPASVPVPWTGSGSVDRIRFRGPRPDPRR